MTTLLRIYHRFWAWWHNCRYNHHLKNPKSYYQRIHHGLREAHHQSKLTTWHHVKGNDHEHRD